MTRELQPGRQPLLWAALFFSSGTWIGVRAWRPPLWWVIAVVAFGLAAVWFVRPRAWFAKGLALGAWFLLGAFLIQVRGAPAADPRIAELADGSVVTVTGHVIREGYVRASGPRSARHPVDIETESIEGAGASADIKCGVRLTIAEVVEHMLGPDKDEARVASHPNFQSLAFTVTLAGTTALLEADAERAEEWRIVQQHPEAQLLKVAHHGSSGSTSADLLAAVHPQYAVVSAGVRNMYGHPRRDVLERLQKDGVKTYRTDMTGAVSFYLDGKTVTPEVEIIR